jgi:excisionase family DNA binding protein
MSTDSPPLIPRQSAGCGAPLLTKQQAAYLLSTSPRHIERLVEGGRLGYCRVGRFIRFAFSDIAEYRLDTRVAARNAQTTEHSEGSR